MKILVAAFAYNERPYIPYMVEYYRKQGCDLLILDNCSTDGTYEWLVENKVKTLKVDTNNSFFLTKLQIALNKEIVKENPDWVLYTGIDSYYFFKGSAQEEIEKAEAQGCNMIEVGHLEAHNTGEKFQLPFPENYFYVLHARRLQMIGKFGPSFRIVADSIQLANRKVYQSEGVYINYGMCKSKVERESTFSRRQKAWKMGEHKGYGTHYAVHKKRDWVWSKPEFTDIRTTDYYKLMK